jgi:hypothetical protein
VAPNQQHLFLRRGAFGSAWKKLLASRKEPSAENMTFSRPLHGFSVARARLERAIGINIPKP